MPATTSRTPPDGITPDGLTDTIRADDPDARLAATVARQPDLSVSGIRALCEPALIEDDVTIIRLARR